MGMFDWIECEYPLPGTVPDYIQKGRPQEFQTKDLECTLAYYKIKSDGTLHCKFFDYEGDIRSEKAVNHTGKIEFYGSNLCSAGPGMYTRHGEDYESVDYSATFVDGVLTNLVQTEYERKPALPSQSFREEWVPPTEEEKAEYARRISETMVGKKVFVLWGGRGQVGYFGEVVAEDEKNLCLKTEKGLELVDRRSRDSTFWDSEEEALAARKKRTDDWETKKKLYDDYAAEWNSKNGKEAKTD